MARCSGVADTEEPAGRTCELLDWCRLEQVDTQCTRVYSEVQYRQLHRGVSLVFYGNGDSLEHDFQLEAGVDPAQILLRFSGTQKVVLNTHGDVVVQLAAGNLLLRRPVAYQTTGKDHTSVDAAFVLAGDWNCAASAG
jgi:hypothetical protein